MRKKERPSPMLNEDPSLAFWHGEWPPGHVYVRARLRADAEEAAPDRAGVFLRWADAIESGVADIVLDEPVPEFFGSVIRGYLRPLPGLVRRNREEARP